jgi:uncharacterized protein YegL
MDRRLPVYLVLDCSESMAGEPFEAMKAGLAQLIAELRQNPMALETAAISLITFSSVARQAVPLTDLIKFSLPPLKMGSGTALGQALTLLEQCIQREVIATTASQKGDYKPVVFILTDGAPTDGWEAAASRIKSGGGVKKANIIAVACGPDADTSVLRTVTEVVIEMRSATPGAFAAFFKWVSASVSVASQRIEQAGERPVDLPNLPQGHLEVPAADVKPAHSADRLAFLHVRCGRTKQDFVGRYEQEGKGGFLGIGKSKYRLVGSYPVPGWEDGEAAQGSMSSDSIDAVPKCPHCANDWIAACQCGRLQCSPPMTGEGINLSCPWCGASGQYGQGTVTLGRGAG